MNQNLRNLIQQLGEAIHQTVSESEQISGVVRDIRNQGFDVLLMLEATIGLNAIESTPGDENSASGETPEVKLGPFTSNDLNFLKSLRISLTGASAAQAEEEETPGE